MKLDGNGRGPYNFYCKNNGIENEGGKNMD